MRQSYKVSDLFYTQWKQVSPQKITEGYTHFCNTQSAEPGTEQHGASIIFTLRALRKNWRLVDKINVLQAVDIFNELEPNLNEPWTEFYLSRVTANVRWYYAPADKMSNRTFDHFIYADSYLTKALAQKDEKLCEIELCKMLAALYLPSGELYYNDEVIQRRAELFHKELKSWQLLFVMYTFGHIKRRIMNGCPNLFPKSSGSSSAEVIKDTLPAWFEIKLQLANAGIFGDYEKVGKTGLYHVINALETLNKEKNQHAKSK
ncbi:MAG: hypothetical protein O9302_00370 [Cyclobacteriaceae bacterium]|jgi:hypothetical protein|nr:hypothetical protein [Cytophagales bacterium]MCZ8326485.1 hypothetical protein [Cyclobacteriaceae bacterium]